MLLTLTTTHRPATDLGYLLGKNPARWHGKSLAYGNATVFYPEATDERCTAALLLDIDPVGLTRGRRRGNSQDLALEPYVNDRPYVASSFFSVAIAQVFSAAMKGKSKDRQELADTPIPLELKLHALPSRGGEALLRRLFEPLGYEVEAERLPLDEAFPTWGDSRYFNVTLRQTVRLAEALGHLYVLIPVLDDDKHYWVGQDELEKLLRMGEGWLKAHPQREEIARRYLKRRHGLVSEALRRLVEEEEPELQEHEEDAPKQEEALERTLSLNERRMTTVVETLKELGATSVLDLGCGEGKLLRALLNEKSFARVAGTDVSMRSLEIAADKLGLERMPPKQRERLELFQSSATYRDARFAGFDAIASVEVVEHLDASRLGAYERVIFEFARPGCIVITTPNQEHNVLFEGLPEGQLRHRDHRFEWTRSQFQDWANGVAQRHGYTVRFAPIGDVHEEHGPPTQMAIFERRDAQESGGAS